MTEQRRDSAFQTDTIKWTVLAFGLKPAPSLFQNAMTRIFEPIMDSALVYIDDILLFSPDIDSHHDFLSKFHDLVQGYGIMLSERKMVIGETTIDFLGMHLSQGQYQLQPHIASQLDNFRDENLAFKQIQQFFGIVNYMAEFIHDLSGYCTPLTKQLKKNAPPWNQSCTNAVKQLKSLTKTLPPLKIPSTGKRVLQTDASDLFWGAVLLEGQDGKRHICGYKSVSFKNGEFTTTPPTRKFLQSNKRLRSSSFIS